ncbi:MAG: hypothetical protein ABIT83_17230 [Massilia sp.]
MDRRLLDYSPVLEAFGADEFAREAEAANEEPALVLGETSELALAAELLAVRTEAGLRQFIARLFDKVQSPGNPLQDTPRGRALAALIAHAARPVLLPLLASSGARRRAAIHPADQASPPLSRAAQLLGLELEGLSQEDKEFAVARQFVRFGAAAASAASRLRGMPGDVAAQAVHGAAHEYAPGLPARHRPASRAGTLGTARRASVCPWLLTGLGRRPATAAATSRAVSIAIRAGVY